MYMYMYILLLYYYQFLSQLYRCTSWDAQNRPSISAILRDLQTLLSQPDTEVKDGQTDIMFDHTDSLGHVMIDLELDDETDNELFKFLLEVSN